MNTFGASKYLEAEYQVVDGIMLDLKDQLTRLKIEELAIRAAIRKQMTAKQAEAGDLIDENRDILVARHGNPSITTTTATTTITSHGVIQNQSVNTHPSSERSQPSTSRNSEHLSRQNEPIEVSINAALELISKYRDQDFMSQSAEDTLDTLGGEIDDTEIDDETEVDEATVVNEDLNFLDLRNCGFDEADFDA